MKTLAVLVLMESGGADSVNYVPTEQHVSVEVGLIPTLSTNF